MITAALTFAFGFLLALLCALLIAPLVWKRARSIAKQEFEATIPANAREIQGTYDLLRAQTAFEARQREIASEERERRAALERADAGRVASENAELKARTKALTKQVSQQLSELEEVNAALSKREAEADEVDSELREVHHDLRVRIEEFEDLGRRFEEMTDIADERKVQIITLETRNDELADELRVLERRARENGNAVDRLSHEVDGLRAQLGKERASNQRLEAKVTRLTGQLSDRDDQLERIFSRGGGERGTVASRALNAEERAEYRLRRSAEVEDGDENVSLASAAAFEETTGTEPQHFFDLKSLEMIDDPAKLREEVANIAARIIDETARQEGPSSPIETILATATDDADEPDRYKSLADRVRAIRRESAQEAAQ
ncbi:hypothetical protein FP2506_13729 [Fulvimarina pelagi HTCC2506]|uniref:Uncharacterized protein n=1 Tax=Fulvimarina pelagi HTCC2506 TaxID=314231 RepID=Q0G4I4_9HYPH|nr:hypothetical protein [Fulvimarina pelagi]EAU41497.1 hypothetical protein FP2506_13729 [Fulvimarina pelagi HTCC2506]